MQAEAGENQGHPPEVGACQEAYALLMKQAEIRHFLPQVRIPVHWRLVLSSLERTTPVPQDHRRQVSATSIDLVQ
ncbi:MAG: hypothetical protein ACR2HZ_03335 [Gemmatimonadaceae bacterium]